MSRSLARPDIPDKEKKKIVINKKRNGVFGMNFCCNEFLGVESLLSVVIN
jgi:hypothetical protein